MSPYKGKYYTKKITVNGKPYYVKAKTKAELERKAYERRKELEAGIDRSQNKTVEDWCLEWLAVYKEPKLSEQTYKDVLSLVNNFIIPKGGIGNTPGSNHIEARSEHKEPRPTLRGVKVKDVKPGDLQRILNAMAKEGYSDAYIKKVRTIMHGLFDKAMFEHLIIQDPTRGIERPEGKPAVRRRSITDRERELTLQVAETHRGGIFILIMLFCGLRPQEVAALNWCDIDLENRIIHVNKAVKGNGVIGKPKSEAGVRDVPIPEYLYVRLAKIEHNPFDLVCTHSQGGQYTRTTIQNMWKTFVRALNIAAGCRTYRGKVLPPYFVQDLKMYCYRHTYCTDLEAAGVPISVAQKLMGHSEISVTANIYSHQSKDSVEAARFGLDQYLSTKVAQ